MEALAVVVVVGCTAAGVDDPAGDVYFPSSPGTPAGGTLPDLVLGGATVDTTAGELRLEFEFADPVLPADDFSDPYKQLHGFVDIDLDVPAVDQKNSNKSNRSGFSSFLGIEASIDFSFVAGGVAPLSDSSGSIVASVPVTFSGTSVILTIPTTVLSGLGTVGSTIAYAAYFTNTLQDTADVFPNGDGHLISMPPTAPVPWMSLPGTGVALGLLLLAGVWTARRRLSHVPAA
jgi:hypothetical protein